jgi:hypothetical protein
MNRGRRVKRAAVLAAAVVVAFGASEVGAEKPVRSERACSLITPGDLESTLGLKGGKPLVGMEIPYTKDANHDHSGSLLVCQGNVGGRYVSVTFGSRPITPEGRKRGEEKIARTQDALRKRGYTIRTGESDGIGCWTMAAPPGDTTGAAMFATTCGGVKGADFYSITVSANGANDIVPMDRLRVLAKSAASRLP